MPMHDVGPEGPKVKYLIGKSAATSAAIAGFIATMIATVSGLWFPGAKLPQFDFNTLNGYLALGLAYGFANPTQNFIIGGFIHMVDGVIWALIFGLIIHPVLGVLKPLRPMTPTVNVMKGLIWGLALWIISSALWMPLLIGTILGPALTGAPPAGFGLPCGVGAFLTCFGPYGVQAVFTNLFWHMIWGVNLGLLFNPMSASGRGTMASGAETTASAAGTR